MASQLGTLAGCLLSLYVVVVLAAFLPPRLLDPGWQVRFANALINNGFLALLGLALVHLAAHLNPSNPHLLRRRNDFAAMAMIAVLGFLFLIPLQGYAVWRGISTANNQQSSQLREVSGRIASLRQEINKSTDIKELQRRLEGLRIAPMAAADLAQPMPVFRRTMLAKLEQTEIRARYQLKGLQPSSLWPLIQSSIRTALSALMLVVGFAAFTRRRRWNKTLLQSWQERWYCRKNTTRGPLRG